MKVKQYRLQKKITQKDMAKTLNISERQYRRIEQGVSAPDIWTAIHISKKLNSTVEELWDGNSTEQATLLV